MKQPRRSTPRAPADDLHDVPASVPVAVRPRFAEVVRLTEAVCRDVLDEDYAQLARKAAEVMARKRPSPLLDGRAPWWEVQEELAERGIIPCVPGDDEDGR